MAMIGSGFTFGSIFAISSVIRSQDQNGNMKSKLQYEIVYYDEELCKYVRKNMPVIFTNSDFNIKHKENRNI